MGRGCLEREGGGHGGKGGGGVLEREGWVGAGKGEGESAGEGVGGRGWRAGVGRGM